MTNEEKIKGMSTEDLARFIYGFEPDCYCCDALKTCKNGTRVGSLACKENLVLWLKQEEIT